MVLTETHYSASVKSLIRSKLNYGAAVYNSTKTSTLGLLNVIRSVTEAFESRQPLVRYMKPTNRREYLSEKLCTHLTSSPNCLAYPLRSTTSHNSSL